MILLEIWFTIESHNTTNEIVFIKTTYENFTNMMIHHNGYYGN